MSRGIEFRLIRPSQDLAEVLRLFELIFNRTASAELWYWKYLPPWTQRPYAWVLVADGRIVGYVGAVPLRGRVGSDDTLFFQLGDAMVHPDYRGKLNYVRLVSMDVLQEIRREHPKALFYGFVGKRTARWCERKGFWTQIESADDRVLRLERLPSSQPSELQVRDWDWEEAGDELRSLWERLKDTIPVGLVRDWHYLRWRYEQHPVYPYRLLGVYERDRVIGWLVTERREGPQNLVARELRVQDLLIPESVRIQSLKQAARMLGTETLVLWLPSRQWPQTRESGDTGWVVVTLNWRSVIPVDLLKQQFFYTVGEADHWWW